MKTENSTDDEELIKLRKTGAVDIDASIALMGESQTLYKDALRMAVKKFPEAVNNMAVHIESGNLIRFAVDMHGVKSILATIGAQSLSKEAADIEEQAGLNNEVLCREIFPEFAKRLMALNETLTLTLSKKKNDGLQSGDLHEPKALLKKMISYLDNCDDNAALEIAEDLSKTDLGGQMNGIVKILKEQIEMFEIENAKANAISLLEHLACKE